MVIFNNVMIFIYKIDLPSACSAFLGSAHAGLLHVPHGVVNIREEYALLADRWAWLDPVLQFNGGRFSGRRERYELNPI